jgi:hypothetical protein
MSLNDRAPFAVPYTSHAIDTGSDEYRAKKPNPPIALCGALSLKKIGSPGVQGLERGVRPRLPEVHLIDRRLDRAQEREPVVVGIRDEAAHCASGSLLSGDA